MVWKLKDVITFWDSILHKEVKKIPEERLNKHSRQFHDSYYPGYKIYETELPPHGRNVSWEAFVKYIAANSGDKVMNYHWTSQFHQCRICNVDYQYITHLENSIDEADFIFQRLKIGKDLSDLFP